VKPLRLRGHHFICLQFFRGEGYSEEFVESLTALLARLTTEPAEAVDTADDVCATCPELGSEGLCESESAGGEDEIRRIDSLAFELLELSPGERVTLACIRDRLAADAVAVGRWRATACRGCAWENVCEPGWGRLLGEEERAARRHTAL
jgi:hypothetical protein